MAKGQDEDLLLGLDTDGHSAIRVLWPILQRNFPLPPALKLKKCVGSGRHLLQTHLDTRQLPDAACYRHQLAAVAHPKVPPAQIAHHKVPPAHKGLETL